MIPLQQFKEAYNLVEASVIASLPPTPSLTQLEESIGAHYPSPNLQDTDLVLHDVLESVIIRMDRRRRLLHRYLNCKEHGHIGGLMSGQARQERTAIRDGRIIQKRQAGTTVIELARRYRLTRQGIYYILKRGLTWLQRSLLSCKMNPYQSLSGNTKVVIVEEIPSNKPIDKRQDTDGETNFSGGCWQIGRRSSDE